MVSNRSTEDIQSDQKYFSSYKSPNISIVPSSSICYLPSPKRPKIEIPIKNDSPQKNIDLSFLDDFDVDEIIKCLNDCEANAQNTTRQSDIENNNILDKDCSKSSFDIDDNRNELKNSITERDLLTKSMDGEATKTIIEKNHTNMNTNITCIETEIKMSSNLNEHAEVYINEVVIEQLSDKTYNTSIDSSNNIIRTEIESDLEKTTEDNNIQELRNEKIEGKSLFETGQDLALTNKASKPLNEEKTTEEKTESSTIINNVDEIKCKEKYLQHSDDSNLQDKNNTTIKKEGTDKFQINETVENKQNTHKSKPFVRNNLKVIDSLQTIDNNKKKDAQKVTESRQVMLPQIGKPKPDMLQFKKLETVLFQCLHKEFSTFSFVHSGKYSKIVKCKDASGEYYAVKMLKKLGNGYRQESLMRRIRDDIPKENLLCIYLIAGFCLKPHWCYLTDYYPKNLNDLLKESEKNLHIDTIQELAGQLIGAVTTLRSKNIVHSDINPSHILLDSTNRKLRVCGFDEAYYIEKANLFPYKGTTCYRAPEVILGFSAGFSLDVWSTALVLHEMATGRQLFGGCTDNHLLYKQMCILGDAPPEMLLRSCFRNKYNIGECLLKGTCFRHKRNSKVTVRNKIACMIQGAYYAHWKAGKNQKQISKDMTKIRQLIGLLDQMLVIYPLRRLPIEFAYANPFIYSVINP